MRYNQVDIVCFSAVLPPVVMTSGELESRLEPLYSRLRLPEGRLEMMTGIRERRFWEAGTAPSDAAAMAAEKALKESGVPAAALQALFYCGVSHDFVEPATSTAVVNKLGLPIDTLNFDISNACLGVISGIMMLATAIESGMIDCGMAVTGENAGPLVENTIRRLNADTTLTRNSVKDEFASLTIGSGAAAVIVCRHGMFPGHRLLAGVSSSDCRSNSLCQGDAAGGMTDGSQPVMKTDSQQLLVKGIEVASRMWRQLQQENCWQDSAGMPQLVCGHQVGRIHRDRLFETLGLPVSLDFPVFPELGNCGSAALPMCCALAAERGALQPGMNLAMLGIGSGINSAGLALKW